MDALRSSSFVHFSSLWQRVVLVLLVATTFLFELSFALASDLVLFTFKDFAWTIETAFWSIVGVPLGFWIVWDYRTLELVAASFILLLVYFGRSGVKFTVLKSVQVMSVLIMVFPVEVYLFSPAMFRFPLCNALFYTPLEWVTYPVVFVASLLTLSATSFLLWALSKRKRRTQS